ncbi:MAG: glycosyl hydrolase 115 family protein, partial [Bacillus sp. (in: firmicutes)]
MEFVINQQMLKSVSATDDNTSMPDSLFYEEKEAFSGVKKIARKVMHDVELVFGYAPQAATDKKKLSRYTVLYGTVDHSPMLHELQEKNMIDLSEIKDKREVYLFQVIDYPFEGVEKALVIAGSDKRGTIYGLFHLSELLGVSPLVDWSDVKPLRKDSFSLSGDLKYISKEPSVRYRGFFINDEWPAFGNWTMKNFGGFNEEMYDHVFELLLRLKGNYLWPAMWSARFSDDGPGLANAELADEYGVVMGASHHEPCLRYGEEYKYLRGENSKYGDAWNFITNREGIIKFWEDGLKRSGKFENVITVGMRGEQDTSIMGKEAALAENIELL